MLLALSAAILPLAAAVTPLRTLPCDNWTGDTATGGWKILSSAGGSYVLRHNDLCLDVADGLPVAAPCQSGKATQAWATNNAKTQLATSGGECLAVSGTSYSIGPALLLAECDPHSMKGVHPPHPGHGGAWSFNGTAGKGQIMSLVGGCCGDIFTTRPVCLAVDTEPTCTSLLAAGATPWCDAAIDPAARAKALIAKMTLEEKASNMDSRTYTQPLPQCDLRGSL